MGRSGEEGVEGEGMSEKVLTPIKAIRAKCLECCNQQFYEVRLCTVTRCSLYPYRMGHRPKKDANPTKISGEDS